MSAPKEGAWPGFAEALEKTDLLVLYIRFREPSEEDFKLLDAYFEAGKPAIAFRTTSHAFSFVKGRKGWFPGVFGGHYMGHAGNGEGTIVMANPELADHPILKGVEPFVKMGYGGTYNAQPLHDTARVLVVGKTGQTPAEPIAWVNEPKAGQRIFYTSLGSRENFEKPAFQKMMLNAVDWCLVDEKTADAVSAERSAPPEAVVPKGAVALFDGTDLKKWKHWDPGAEPKGIEIDGRAHTLDGAVNYDDARWPVENGAAVARPGFGDIVSRQSFGNYELHLDFLLPNDPDYVQAPFRGNSGVYIDGRYEIQIADSHGAKADQFSCGAINGVKAPESNAAKPAGQWQSMDIKYVHLDDEEAKISVWLNGVQVQKDVVVTRPTQYGFRRSARRISSGGDGSNPRFVTTVEQAEKIRLGGDVFTVEGRFKTRGNGTIFSKCAYSGKWSEDAKAIFLRNGRLVYDIGWVGQMGSRRKVNDG
ncbi:MAG: family 16 glycoside hydrolase, partial [Verrucomicrobiota bacterium]